MHSVRRSGESATKVFLPSLRRPSGACSVFTFVVPDVPPRLYHLPSGAVIAMSLGRRVLSVSALTILAAWLPHEARAQGILDRIKKLGQNTAIAGKKAVVDEANGQINSAVQDAAAEHVADGSFVAVLSPWASTGVAKRVEIARFSGEAFVVTTPNSREIMLCDDKSTQSWLTSFAIQKKAPVTGGGAGSAPGAHAGAAHGVAHVGGGAAHA